MKKIEQNHIDSLNKVINFTVRNVPISKYDYDDLMEVLDILSELKEDKDKELRHAEERKICGVDCKCVPGQCRFI